MAFFDKTTHFQVGLDVSPDSHYEEFRLGGDYVNPGMLLAADAFGYVTRYTGQGVSSGSWLFAVENGYHGGSILTTYDSPFSRVMARIFRPGDVFFVKFNLLLWPDIQEGAFLEAGPNGGLQPLGHAGSADPAPVALAMESDPGFDPLVPTSEWYLKVRKM